MADIDDDTDEGVLATAKKRYQESEDCWSEAKNKYSEDTRFARLGEQWPLDIVQQRQLEGRPCSVVNKMPAFIRSVVNDMRQNRPRIKTRAANSSACSKVAELLDGLIRQIEAVSNADVAYDTAGECAVQGGFGFFRIDVDYEYNDTFDMGLFIRSIPNPLSVSWDPFSQTADSSDWRWCFITEVVPLAQHKLEYPDATVDPQDFGDGAYDAGWLTTDSIRRAEYWTRDEKEKTIYLLANGEVVDAETYDKLDDEAQLLPELAIVDEREVKGYEVTHRIITGAEVLKTTKWAGSYIPVIPVWGDEVNVEGERIFQSLIRHAKDSQRMLNYWRTAATELVSLAPKAPWVGAVGSFDTDADKWETANQKSWPKIEYDPVPGQPPPARSAFAGVPAGALSEAANANDDMKAILGLYDASLGAKSNETSGIAIHRRMAEGDVSTFHFIDNLNRGIRHAGCVLLDLIPRVYSKPRVLRILGLDGKCTAVAVNQPPQIDPITGAALNEIYDLTVGRYDAVVEAGPSYTTQRTETADMLTQVIGAAPQTAPLLVPMLLKMSDFPESDKASRILATMMPPEARAVFDGTPIPAPQPPPEVAMEQAKAQANFALQKEKANLDAQLEQQKATNKIQLEREQAQADIIVMRDKAQAEMQLARERAALDAQLKRQEAELSAQLKLIGAAQAPQPIIAPGVQ